MNLLDNNTHADVNTTTQLFIVNQIAIVAVMIIISKPTAPNELVVTPLLTLLKNDYKNIIQHIIHA